MKDQQCKLCLVEGRPARNVTVNPAHLCFRHLPNTDDDADAALDEIAERYIGLPGAGLSDEADFYLLLRYEPDPSYLFSAELPSDVWFRHRVLPDDVMAILEAVRAHEAAQEVEP